MTPNNRVQRIAEKPAPADPNVRILKQKNNLNITIYGYIMIHAI